MKFIQLPHAGTQYTGVPHYGILLWDGIHTILTTGDCAIATPTLTSCLKGIQVDLAILDFPWLTLRRGREYLENILQPKHLILCHFPPPSDNMDYLMAAKKAANHTNLLDVRLLAYPLQSEMISL